MKWIVGIVAAAALGCGVGVDDPEGMAAAGLVYTSGAQALTAQTTASTDTGTTPSEGGSTGGTTVIVPGAPTAAPQDPIPAFDPSVPGEVFGTSPVPGQLGPRPLR